jgi:hypothetical protein
MIGNNHGGSRTGIRQERTATAIDWANWLLRFT